MEKILLSIRSSLLIFLIDLNCSDSFGFEAWTWLHSTARAKALLRPGSNVPRLSWLFSVTTVHCFWPFEPLRPEKWNIRSRTVRDFGRSENFAKSHQRKNYCIRDGSFKICNKIGFWFSHHPKKQIFKKIQYNLMKIE